VARLAPRAHAAQPVAHPRDRGRPAQLAPLERPAQLYLVGGAVGSGDAAKQATLVVAEVLPRCEVVVAG
jgi:hypothetical protein